MMLAAARALGAASPAATAPRSDDAPLLPSLRDIRSIAREIALAVGMEAQRSGVAPEMPEAALRERVRATQWVPEYAI